MGHRLAGMPLTYMYPGICVCALYPFSGQWRTYYLPCRAGEAFIAPLNSQVTSTSLFYFKRPLDVQAER